VWDEGRPDIATAPEVPGLYVRRMKPGGRRRPDESSAPLVRGGQVWEEVWLLGSDADDFVMAIPDIRLPANQFWPMHWHDEWILVLVLDGAVLLGDRWMNRGDLAISPPDVEYGPLVAGPDGVQLFEVFARGSFGGGYATEYRDHPTLSGEDRVCFSQDSAPRPANAALISPFGPRPAGSAANDGRSACPINEAPRLVTGTLSRDGCWDLGEPTDPTRGVFLERTLQPDQRLEPQTFGDWHMLLIWEGSIAAASREFSRDEVLTVPPNVRLPEMKAGDSGAHLVEFARTAYGARPQ
jgi:hypothetical protein